jgi:hypothetical protein
MFCLGGNCTDYLLFISCYQIAINFYEEEYINFIFDFVPLCAGNFACSDFVEIFYRPYLNREGLLYQVKLNQKKIENKEDFSFTARAQ